jgi:hypothetical protein
VQMQNPKLLNGDPLPSMAIGPLDVKVVTNWDDTMEDALGVDAASKQRVQVIALDKDDQVIESTSHSNGSFIFHLRPNGLVRFKMKVDLPRKGSTGGQVPGYAIEETTTPFDIQPTGWVSRFLDWLKWLLSALWSSRHWIASLSLAAGAPGIPFLMRRRWLKRYPRPRVALDLGIDGKNLSFRWLETREVRRWLHPVPQSNWRECLRAIGDWIWPMTADVLEIAPNASSHGGAAAELIAFAKFHDNLVFSEIGRRDSSATRIGNGFGSSSRPPGMLAEFSNGSWYLVAAKPRQSNAKLIFRWWIDDHFHEGTLNIQFRGTPATDNSSSSSVAGASSTRK